MTHDVFAQKVGVICGGFSRERDVSLRSGQAVLDALKRQGVDAVKLDPLHDAIASSGIDVAFPMLHGFYGEDGGIQSYLEQHGIPYVGSRIRSCQLSMNKLVAKQVMAEHNAPTPAFFVLMSADTPLPSSFSFPLIVKPLSEGSSVGVEIFDTKDAYLAALPALLDRFGVLLVEAFVEGKEVTISVLDGDGSPNALPVLELRPKRRFYDYEAKYTPGMTEFILPADLNDETTTRVQRLAEDIHVLFGCSVMSRTDMIVDSDDQPWILEINTIPGMTATSDLPAQAKAAGIDFDDLVLRMLKGAR